MKSGGVEQQFYLGLIECLLDDFAVTAHQKKWLKRDIVEMRTRVATRGISSLISDLASLGKAVLSGIESGVFVRPPGFSARRKSVLPAFLQGVLTLIFRDDGVVHQEPDPYALQECMMVCGLLYKLELPPTPSQEKAVIDAFVATEAELQQLELPTDFDRWAGNPTDRISREILVRASSLIHDVMSGFDPTDITPKHGPGAVATGEYHNEKYTFARKYDSLHQCYPYYRYFAVPLKDGKDPFGKGRVVPESVLWLKNLPAVPYGVAKVILVPKDARGPRLISSEPLEFQWIQGGLGDKFKTHVETTRPSRGYVNFTSQDINRHLAMQSSITREHATLDLKEASDRVSVDLVRALFPERIHRYLMSSRSDATTLPSGDVIALSKFAPMGSALCFPVLALTVWALTEAILSVTFCDLLERPFTGPDKPSKARQNQGVFVYGDDLIVPNDAFDTVSSWLPRFGLAVNTNKSFHRSFFRESCGMDAYKGVQVSPIRVKKRWTSSSSNGSQFASYTALSNRFFEAGCWKTSNYLVDRIERLFGPLPYGTGSSGFPCITLGNVADALTANERKGIKRRWRTKYQRVEFLVNGTSDKTVESPFADAYAHAVRALVRPVQPIRPGRALSRWDSFENEWDNPLEVVVPRSTVIKRGWQPAA